ncbi:MAG: hypothetical protein ACD_80C00102G0016 [uncultured bacterium (gcode 4)]|uniref:Integral membrane protein TerC n=1 Tax=uncultured bacterium (gcode 4) TaxID=1234023 RepID=K1YIM5_9BACT|nr:MAG: hypothetical protein ACD_80C00102G0016 [uncultured bacterium (gcode 4)]
MKHFRGSILFTIIAVITAFFLWAGKALDIAGGLQMAFIVIILWILEVSLSFDNAVVNAKILKKMDAKWQHRFLTRGMAIAVFGMRIIFPLIIVAIVGGINPLAAFNLAIFDPNQYATILTASHITIAGFGGAFLLLVALNFFLDAEKETHRIGYIEKYLQKIWALKSMEIIVTMIVVYIIGSFLPAKENLSFLIASMRWIILFVLIEGIASILQTPKWGITNIHKIWLSLFLYLEVLDASFSFDGVIGAFALSKNIFVIALGLWIGAMFVRSLTIMLVHKWTLAKYKYLEHGAFWAIFALAAIMFLGTLFHISETLTGILWAIFIWLALWSSVRENRKNLT